MAENKTADNLGIEQGLHLHSAGEHRVAFGEKPHTPIEHQDLSVPNATMSGLRNFVKARAEAITARAHESMVKVNTRAMTITLVVGEHGKRKLSTEDKVTPVVEITGSTKNSADFTTVKGYMKRGGHSSAHELAMDLRANAHLFTDISECARVVNALRSVQLTVQKVLAEVSEDNKLREKRMTATITEGNLDLTWNWNIELFEGEEAVKIPVRAIFEVQANFIDVNVVILDASGIGLTLIERNAKRELMEEAANAISAAIPSVPLVYVD